MKRRIAPGLLSVFSVLWALNLNGCRVETVPLPVQVSNQIGLRGSVRGGQQPIEGATVQMYAAGNAGDGSAATPLLTNPATTDSSGSFSVTGTYSCPSASASVYLVATGGRSSLSSNANNAAISLMVVLGPCGGVAPAATLSINEVTTIAATSSLTPFMSSVANLGSSSADAAVMSAGFAAAAELVNSAMGSAPGINLPPGTTVPTQLINSLGNVVSACVNSAGGVAGDGSACGNLFALTTPPGGSAAKNTLDALLQLARNPGLQTNAIFGQSLSFAPFQPALTAAPADYVIRLGYNSTLAVAPSSLSFPTTYAGFPSASQTFTIANAGASPAALSVSLVGANAQDFTPSSSCPAVLAPGASCAVPVIFAPSAPGVRSASVSVKNGSTGQFLNLPVSGPSAASAAPLSFSQSLNSSTAFMGASIVNYWPMPIHNLGVPGQVTSQMLARFSSQVLGQGYTRVVILGGSNDIIDGLPNLPNELTTNLEAMAELARGAGMEVVLSELPPINYNGVNYNTTVVEVDAAIHALAMEHGYLVVDYYTPMYGHPEYFVDGLHPSAAGYAVMEQALAGVVIR